VPFLARDGLPASALRISATGAVAEKKTEERNGLPLIINRLWRVIGGTVIPHWLIVGALLIVAVVVIIGAIAVVVIAVVVLIFSVTSVGRGRQEGDGSGNGGESESERVCFHLANKTPDPAGYSKKSKK